MVPVLWFPSQGPYGPLSPWFLAQLDILVNDSLLVPPGLGVHQSVRCLQNPGGCAGVGCSYLSAAFPWTSLTVQRVAVAFCGLGSSRAPRLNS